MAHITGGGFYENIARILPPKCRAIVFKKRWPVPPIFDVIQQRGNIPEREMYTVFNMGIGMIAVVDRRNVGLFRRIGGLEIGHVEKGTKEVKVV
jgi:phosphoribosylformylglycinamidine cyclo-ligase